MTRQPDLLSALNAPCGTCRHMTGPALASGVRYCTRWATWQSAADRIDCKTHEEAA